MRPTTTDHRRRIAARPATAALLAAGVLVPVFAHAAATPPPVVCVNSFTVSVTPGFTMTPGGGKLSSNGQTGSLECFGTIAGQRITGPGTVGFVEKHTSGTCRGHTGTGRVHLIIPTTAGEKHLYGALAVRRTGLTVRVKVRFPAMRYSGNGVIFPRKGDCTSTPLEQIRVTMTGTLSET